MQDKLQMQNHTHPPDNCSLDLTLWNNLLTEFYQILSEKNYLSQLFRQFTTSLLTMSK